MTDSNNIHVIASNRDQSQTDIARVVERIKELYAPHWSQIEPLRRRARMYEVYLRTKDSSLVEGLANIAFNNSVIFTGFSCCFEGYQFGEDIIVGFDAKFNIVIAPYGQQERPITQQAIAHLRDCGEVVESY